MTMCCPLREADEAATVYNSETRTARKDHVCYECRKAIPRRTKYVHISMLFDGTWDDFKLCLLCEEIGDHFSCGRGRLLGELWSDLQQYFFRDMSAGGTCMDGLSPAAKGRLFEARMEWYFDQDEIDDSAWEDWPKHRDRQREIRTPVDNRTVLFGDEPRNFDWEAPEVYWPRQLKLEEDVRSYDAAQALVAAMHVFGGKS